MLSNGFDAPLRLNLKPSRLLLRLQVFVHALALLAVLIPSSIPLLIKSGVFAFVIGHILLVIRSYLRDKKSDELIIWRKDSTWAMLTENEVTNWHCQPQNLVTAWFVIVNLSAGRKKRVLLVVKDQCGSQIFRRLKVRLKYHQGEAAIPIDAS